MTRRHTRREALFVILSSAGSPLVLSRNAEASPAYNPRFFSVDQMQAVDALAETIIPADGHSPGARAARVSEYIDTIVSEAKPDVKALWSKGLASIEQLARNAYGTAYAQCSGEQQNRLMAGIAANEEKPHTLEERFFCALKNATVDGYYTSAVGIHKDLEYQGNTMVIEFPGCEHESHEGLQAPPTTPLKASPEHRH